MLAAVHPMTCRTLLVSLALLGAPLAIEVQAAGTSFEQQLILTEWGTFHCSAVDCGPGPRAGLDVYWSPPTLVLTRNHVPLVMRTCHPLPGLAAWDCRPSQPLHTVIGLDMLWSWVEWAETDPEDLY